MKKLVLLVLMVALLPLAQTQAHSDEDEDFTIGRIVSISEAEIIIIEDDYESEEYTEIQVSYVLSNETILENIQTLAELFADDEVEIIFIEEDGKKKAKRLVKVIEYDWDNSVFELESEEAFDSRT